MVVAENAVIVRNAKKTYGGKNPILNGLDMNVPKGSIYGLLGASGCGKTTLLSCIVGVRNLDEGSIWVLGGRPGNKNSGIPGPRVGYMPQDISLMNEFCVTSALNFFGNINGMDGETIEERSAFLKDLLQLPPDNRLVKNMSGGQQRRVSFAAALLHKPELLILDEPTVGLDPVLRDNIWNHLVKLTKEEQVTIIITTHYIEEAKQADKIGLLRDGLLLAETSPTELLARWQTDSLEEVFLNLSQMQSQHQTENVPSFSSNETITVAGDNEYHGNYTANMHKQRLKSNWKKRCKALLMKNTLQFVLHPGGMLFSLFLPILQITLFYHSIGPELKDLKISVVNEEAGNCNGGRYFGNVTYDPYNFTCNFHDLSCKFLTGIEDSFLKKLYYDSYDEALDEIASDKSVAIMRFRRNFSDALQERLDNFLSLSEEDIIDGQIEITIQTPDRQVHLYLQKKLYKLFFDGYREIMKQCKIVPKSVNLPIKFEEPIFGKLDQDYRSFVAPPYLLTVIFILATSICSSIIMTDRHSGIWDRILVQGVTTTEILLTHLISQITLIVMQVVALLVVYFGILDSECKGSMATVSFLTLLDGICGMSYGLTMSVLFTSYTLVNYAAVGSFYPLILLSGIMWPIEGMPKVLRWFSLSLPLTKPGMSMRAVIEKGMSISDEEVYVGILVTSVWIVGFITICLFRLKIKGT